MADPFSFTASVIAVTTLTFHVSRLVRNIFHASDEILALKNEVENVAAVASRLQSLCQQLQLQDQQTGIAEAKRILDDVVTKRLQKIQGYLDSLESNRTKATQTIRYLALRRKINAEREGLHGARQRLFPICLFLQVLITRYSSIQATNIDRNVQDIQTTQIQNHQEILARLDQYHGPVQNAYMQDYHNVLARFDQYFGPIQGAHVHTHRDILACFNQYLDRIPSMLLQNYQRVLIRLFAQLQMTNTILQQLILPLIYLSEER